MGGLLTFGGCSALSAEGVCKFCIRQTQLRVLFSSHSLPFWVKEKANKLKNEIREVEELDSWQPAVPLLQSLLPVGGSKNLQKVA